MRKSMFAAVVVAATLPTLAFAGEPVPMTDSDLDSVAAGLSLRDLQLLSAEQILAHPEYGAAKGEALARFKLVPANQHEALQTAVRARILAAGLSSSDHRKLRAITPAELQHLLPPLAE